MKKILLLHTGGTLGMNEDLGKRVFVPPEFAHDIHEHVPQLEQLADIDVEILFNIDSSDIGISHWQQLADRVHKNIDRYDGFVIIHGTDTMVFTATALSFMLKNLPKPVILTGSQRPLSMIRNDARNNLINAVELATSGINEVAILFSNRLFRGNRCKKISINEFDAFSSPNYPILAQVGLNIEMEDHLLLKPGGRFELLTAFDNRIACMRAFPGAQREYYRGLLKTDVRAVVLEAFGSGNIPLDGKGLLSFIKACTQDGRIVVINSQCIQGSVDLHRYGGGKQALEAGAWSAGDMTVEATMVKLMFLLGNHPGDPRKIQADFAESLAGEITM